MQDPYHCDNCNADNAVHGYTENECAICEIVVLTSSLHELYMHVLWLKGCFPLPHSPGHLVMKRAKDLLELHDRHDLTPK